MSLRAARLLAVPFALLAFGLRLAETFWLRPWTWRSAPDGVSLTVGLIVLVAELAVPVLLYLWATRGVRHRPATWVVDPDHRRFVAPGHPRWVGLHLVLGGWLAAGLIPTERVPGQDRMRLAPFDVYATVAVVLAVVLLLVLGLNLLTDRHRIALDADGLALGPGSRRRVPWTDLSSGGPPPPLPRDPVALAVRRPNGAGWRTRRVHAQLLHVDSAFLAYTIRVYADRPERRAAIGTDAELAALRSGFPGFVAAPVSDRA